MTPRLQPEGTKPALGWAGPGGSHCHPPLALWATSAPVLCCSETSPSSPGTFLGCLGVPSACGVLPSGSEGFCRATRAGDGNRGAALSHHCASKRKRGFCHSEQFPVQIPTHICLFNSSCTDSGYSDVIFPTFPSRNPGSCCVSRRAVTLCPQRLRALTVTPEPALIPFSCRAPAADPDIGNLGYKRGDP